MINTRSGVFTQFVSTDVNLIEMHKSALVSGATHISWERGVIDLTHVVAIIDNSPIPATPKVSDK